MAFTVIDLYDDVQITVSSILILMYTVTLVRSIAGKGFAFTLKLLTMLILSNIGSIIVVKANIELVGDNSSGPEHVTHFWMWV